MFWSHFRLPLYLLMIIFPNISYESFSLQYTECHISLPRSVKAVSDVRILPTVVYRSVMIGDIVVWKSGIWSLGIEEGGGVRERRGWRCWGEKRVKVLGRQEGGGVGDRWSRDEQERIDFWGWDG